MIKLHFVCVSVCMLTRAAQIVTAAHRDL